MPNTTSATKAMRSSAKKRSRNKSIKSALKTSLTKAEKLISQDLVEEAGPAVTRVASGLDKAAQKGIIHPNKASRHKSRLAKKLSRAQRAVAEAAAAPAPEPQAAAPKKRTSKRTSSKA